MFKLKLTAKAKKELKYIQKSYKMVVALALEDIKDSPFSGKPLSRELLGKFSYRVGMYRIIYTVNKKDKIITIVSDGHRATIYQ